MQLVVQPGADLGGVLRGVELLERREEEVLVRGIPAERAALRRIAAAPGVRDVRVELRAPEPPGSYLTRRVAATFPEGVDAAVIAARHGARIVAAAAGLPRTFVLEASDPLSALDLARSLVEQEGLAFAEPQVARQQTLKGRRRLVPNDTLFPNQWHLQNSGQSGGTTGEDVRAVPAWDVTQGAGVVIGIIDDGLQHTHPDLAPNYSAALSIDIFSGDSDPAPVGLNDHGTAVAGVAAARGENGLGVAGSAYLATLAGIRLTAGATTDADEASAMSHQNAAIFIKSNSWGPSDNGATLQGAGPLTRAAIADGVATGRGGRGVIYLWAAGNGLEQRDNVNFDGYANLRHAIAVAAIDHKGVQSYYSEPGAALLVTAPSSGDGVGITTTDRTGNRGYGPGDYTSTFGGTSSATPLAAGVVALILSANPQLSYRDVRHVLVRSARTNDPSDPDWFTNSAGHTVNHKYGHGGVDAEAGVALAQQWTRLLTPETSPAAVSGSPNLAIPDSPGPTGTSGGVVSQTLSIPGTTPVRIEYVEVDFSATHTYRGDLRVTLTAPSGTKSVLADYRGDPGDNYSNWTFMSARHWGETAAGDWKLEVEDLGNVDVGTWTGWTLRVYGSPVDTTAPAPGLVNDGAAADIDVQTSTSTIQANWSGFGDTESVPVFEWAIGILGSPESVQSFTPVGYAVSASASGLALTVGQTYIVTVQASNFDGLITTATSDGVLIQPDTTPPPVPAAPDLAAGSDSGASSSDNITNDTTPEFTGTTEAGATVTLFDGATPVGSTTADGAGAYSVTPAVALGSGVHSITVIATDGAGNPSASSPATSVTIDTSAPPAPAGAPDLLAASDTGTSATDNVTADATPTFIGTVAAGATVTLLAGAVPVGTTTADGGGSYTVTASTLAGGVFVMTVTATDVAGNASGPSPTLTVTIDLSIATPGAPDLVAASDTGTSSTDNLTADATPTFAGTTEPGAAVTLFAGPTSVGTATADGGGLYSVTASVMVGGTYSFTVQAVDAAGNSSAASGGLSVTLDLSVGTPIAPDLTAASDTGASSTDNLTSNTTPSFTGTTESGASVTLLADGNPVGSATANGAGAFTVTASVLTPATYAFMVQATDVAGNVSAASPPLAVTIDTAAPATPAAPDLSAASDSGISATDNVTSDVTPTFTGTVAAGLTVTLYAGISVVGSAVADGLGAYSVTASALAAGPHDVSVTATDGAGNTSPASLPLTVTIDLSSATPAAPDLLAASDTGASATDNLTSDATPAFTGTCEPGSSVSLFAGLSLVGSATADGAGAYSVTASAILEGTYAFTVQAVDPAGNTSAASPGLSVTIDVSIATPGAPDLTAASDTGASNTDNLTGDTTPSFTGTTESAASLTLLADGNPVGSATANGAGSYTVTASLLTPATYQFTVQATDVAGNLSVVSAPLAVTIDTSAPAAPAAPDLAAGSDSGSSPSDDVTSDATPTFTGTVTAGFTVTLYAGVSVVGSAVADGVGAYTVTASTIAAGTHTFSVTTTDGAGNASAASPPLSVTIDVSISTPGAPDLRAASDTGASATDNVTSDATPTFTGTTEAGAAVTLFAGAVTVGTATADGAGAYTVTASVMVGGTYSFTVQVVDLAGNTSAASPGLSVTLDLSIGTPIAPDLTAASDTGASSTDDLTSDTTPSFTGSTESGASLTLLADGNPVGSATANGAGAYTVTASALTPATVQFTVQATDVAGNVSAVSPALAVTIDTSAPAAPAAPDLAAGSDSGSSASDNLTSDATPTFTGTVGAGFTVTLYAGVSVVGSAVADGSGAYTVTASTMAAGTHDFSLTVTDGAGNTSIASLPLTVSIDTVAPSPIAPDLLAASDSGSSATDNVTSDDTPAFSGTTEPGTAVALYSGAVQVGSATSDGTGAYAVTSSTVAAGFVNFTVRVTDLAGNLSAPSPGLGVTIDTTAPIVGVVNDGLAGDIDVQASTSVISANWSGFSDAGSGIGGYEWAIGVPGTPESVQTFTDVGPAVSGTASGLSLSNGLTYIVTVRARNIAGLSVTQPSDGVLVNGPQAPAITSAHVTVATAGVAYAYDVEASGNPVPAFLLVVAPSGMQIDPSTGVITWIPTQAQIGSHPVTVTAFNGVAPDDTANFTVTVGASPLGQPPLADAGADSSGGPGGYTLDASASSDPEGGTLGFAWTEDPANPILGRLRNTASAQALFLGTVQGVYTFHLTVTDPTGLLGTAVVEVTIANVAPVAEAGPDLVVEVGTAVTLDGRGSTDGNGTPLSFLWTEAPANPAVGTLSNSASAVCTFQASVPGTYLLTLQVDDGLLTDTDTLRVDVVRIPVPTVVPPSAHAGADRVLFLPTGAVALDGSGSVDPDDPAGTLVFSWTEDPSNPATGLLSSASAESPTFTPALPGRYGFTLTVTDAADDNLTSLPDSVTVWVETATDLRPVPTATSSWNDADADGLVDVGETVTLSGAGSTDPEGAPLSFTWTQVGGPAISGSASGATLTFTPSVPGTYVFQVAVSDAAGTGAPATVVVQVVPDTTPPTVKAPVAVARANGTAGTVRLTQLPGDPAIVLDGTTSQDNDGDALPLAFRWSRLEGPTAPLGGADTASASFTPLISATYVIRLRVTDTRGLWDEAEVTVIVDTFDVSLNPTGNGVPTAVLQPVADTVVGAPVTLDGTASSDPVDADSVTGAASGLLFFFTQVGGPSTPLSAGAPGTVTLTPATAGTYSFALVVSDGSSFSSPSTVSFVVSPASPAPPAPSSGHRRRKRCGSLGLDLLLPLGIFWMARRILRRR